MGACASKNRKRKKIRTPEIERLMDLIARDRQPDDEESFYEEIDFLEKKQMLMSSASFRPALPLPPPKCCEEESTSYSSTRGSLAHLPPQNNFDNRPRTRGAIYIPDKAEGLIQNKHEVPPFSYHMFNDSEEADNVYTEHATPAFVKDDLDYAHYISGSEDSIDEVYYTPDMVQDWIKPQIVESSEQINECVFEDPETNDYVTSDNIFYDQGMSHLREFKKDDIVTLWCVRENSDTKPDRASWFGNQLLPREIPDSSEEDDNEQVEADQKSSFWMPSISAETSSSESSSVIESFSDIECTTEEDVLKVSKSKPAETVVQRMYLPNVKTQQTTFSQLNMKTGNNKVSSNKTLAEVPVVNEYEETRSRRTFHQIEEAVKMSRSHIIEKVTVHQILPYLHTCIDQPEIENIRLISQNDNRKAAEQLLESIQSSNEPGKWQLLVEALEGTGHQAAVRILKQEPIADTKRELKILHMVAPRLREMIVPHEIISALKAFELITPMDGEEIMAKERQFGNVYATDHMLQCIPRKHPDWYKRFLEAVADRPELLEIIEPDYATVNCKSYCLDGNARGRYMFCDDQKPADSELRVVKPFNKHETEQIAIFDDSIDSGRHCPAFDPDKNVNKPRKCHNHFPDNVDEEHRQKFVNKMKNTEKELELLENEIKDLEKDCEIQDRKNALLRKKNDLKTKLEAKKKEEETLQIALSRDAFHAQVEQSSATDKHLSLYSYANNQQFRNRTARHVADETYETTSTYGSHEIGLQYPLASQTSSGTILGNHLFQLRAPHRRGVLLPSFSQHRFDLVRLYDVDLTYQDSAFYSDLGNFSGSM